MILKIAACATLALSIAAGAHAQSAAVASAHYIGYTESVIALENGSAFCASKESLRSLKSVIQAERASIDGDKPAKGMIAAMAKAFPCADAAFKPPRLDLSDVARDILQIDITADDEANAEFRSQYPIGVMFGALDLYDGDSICMEGSTKKLSEALKDHQRATGQESVTPQFFRDALRKGYPCSAQVQQGLK